MIRASSHSLKFSNVSKRETLTSVLNEYRRLAQAMIDDMWSGGSEEALGGFNPAANRLHLGVKLAPIAVTAKHTTWLSARMRQACAKQALAMVKSATEKRRKQLWKLADEQKKGNSRTRLQSKIDRQPLVKPTANRINMELDSRFVDFVHESGFCFLRLSSIGNKVQVKIPLKRTRVSATWSKRGQLKDSVRVSDATVCLLYDVERAPIQGQETVGADQGLVTTISLSDGQTTKVDPQGHSLTSILEKMSRKKKGSKAFRKVQEHRKNYINWSLNRLNFNNIKELRLEEVKNLRKGRRSSRKLSHWCYPLIKDKVIRLSEEKGFLFREVSSEFRSQRCSLCGWVRKANRKGKTFKCGKCFFEADADLNAASNLAVDLYEVPYWVRHKKINRAGFYWMPTGLFSEGQEPIVPVTDKPCVVSQNTT